MEKLQRSEGDEIDSVEAKRSPKSFLQESYFESICYPRISPLSKGKSKKSGDNSDRKNDSYPERPLTRFPALIFEMNYTLQTLQKLNNRQQPFIKVLQVEMLIRCMQVLVWQTEAHHNSRNTKHA